jgi:hypothetical protein
MKKIIQFTLCFLFLLGTASISRAQTYCTTGLYSSGCSFGDYINNFTLANLSHSASGCSGGAAGYGNFTIAQPTINLTQGAIYSWSATFGFSSQFLSIWIDFNNNGLFSDAGDQVYSSATSFGSSGSGSFTLSSSAATGSHRLRVRCKYSGTTITSGQSCTAFTYGETHDYTVNVVSAGYCTTGLYSSSGCSFGDNINSLTVSDLNHTATGCTGGTGVANYTATTVNFAPNTSYNYTLNCSYTSSEYVGWWIDFNNNNSFADAGEYVLTSQVGNGGNITGTILIPNGAATGNHRMRVRVVYANTQSSSTSCALYTYGEAHDYTANISSCSPVSIAPTTISGATTICSGQSTTLTASGGSLASGGSVQWFTGSCGGTLIFTGNPITVTPSSTTTYFVRYNSACGATNCISTPVTVNPIPTASVISPSSPSICTGGNVVLSSTLNYSGTSSGTVNGFTSSYAPGNWTTINTVGGSFNTSGAPNSISITSGNSGIAGGTEMRLTVPANGTISFTWSYSTIDGAAYDYPQYTTNGSTYTNLPGYSTSGSSIQGPSTASIAVTAGSIFGIRMYTADGGFGAATTIFSNFSGPGLVPGSYNYSWSPTTGLTGVTSGTASGSFNSSVTASPGSDQVYTVTASAGSCTATRNVTVTVLSGSISQYNVTGGGSACLGNGVAVGLSGSTSGDSYQLIRNGSPVGSPVTGDGSAISFGSQTLAGTYTVSATSGSCSAAMTGSAVVSIVSIIPTASAISPSSPSICEGNSITLSSTVAYSAIVTGTISGFTSSYAPGNWAVTNPAGGTVNTSGAPASITIVSGNSGFSGGTDFTITVAATGTISFNWSYTTVDGAPYDYPMYTTNGVTYSIMTGYSTGGGTSQSGSFSSAVTAGSVFGIRMYTADGVFGSATTVFSNFQVVGSVPASFTYAWAPNESLSGTTSGTVTTGSLNSSVIASPASAQIYTVTATANGCSSSSSVTVGVSPGLSQFNVTGGGSSCSGGFPVGLSGSSNGVSYQLLRDGNPVGSPIIGDGSALNFGTFTTSGTYTVEGNGAGCITNMTGSAVIIIAGTPVAAAITPSSPTICAGNNVVISSALSIAPISTTTVSGFSGSFSPGNWSIANTVGGSVNTSGAPSSITIVSGNSSIAGATDYTITAPANGTISFNWSYTTIDGPQYDYPMYTVNGSSYFTLPGYSTIGSVTQSGSFSMAVTAGAVFGLRMYTVDGVFGSATTVFSNFSAVGAVYPDFTYEWSPSGSLSGLVSGTVSSGSLNSSVTASPGSTQEYTVVATGPGGCTASRTVTVNVVAPPTSFDVTGGGIYCAGSGLSVDLSGSTSGISYQLLRNAVPYGAPASGTGSALSFTNLTLAGTYTITATGPYCTVNMNGPVSISISTPPVATASVSPLEVCPGATVNLTGGGTLTGAVLNWSASPAGSIADPSSASTTANPTVPTTYTFSVSANGCTTTATTLEVAILTGPPVTVTASLSSVCYGSSLNLTSDATGGNWSSSPAGFTSSDQNPSATPLVATSYTYTKVNPDGCISTGTTPVVNILPLPAPAPTNNGPKCEGTAMGLFTNITAASYSWSGPAFSSPYNYTGAGNQNPSFSAAQVVAGIGGTYTVIATGSNGCTSSASTTMTIHQLPVAQPSITTSPACAGSSITLNGGVITTGAPIATNGWLWSGPGYTSTVSIQNPVIGSVTTANQGNFTLRVRDTHSPQCLSAAVIVPLVVNVAPVFTASPIENSNIAAGIPVSGTCGKPVTYTVTASGTPAPAFSYLFTGATSGSGSGTGSGSTFYVGVTNVTVTAQNVCATIVRNFTITVDPIPITTAVSVSPSTQQYSDMVTLTATLPNGAACSPQAVATATFSIGSPALVLGTAPFVPDGANLVATLTVPLLDPSLSATTPPSGPMAPGNHSITVALSAVDGQYAVVNTATAALTITKENATVEYSGTVLQATQSSSSSNADVQLSSKVYDISATDLSDANAGDIRNARVMFVNRDAANAPLSPWLVPDLIDGDPTMATVSYNWTANIGNATDVQYTVGIVVNNGYYFKDNPEDNVVVTVYKPAGDRVTGGGSIRPTASAGPYASIPGRRTHFGYNVKFNANGSNLQGQMNIMFVRQVGNDVRTYQIKVSQMISLGVNVTDPNRKTSNFVAKANLKELSNNNATIASNCGLFINMIDRGEPGANDSISIALTTATNRPPTVLNNILYASSWISNSVKQMILNNGNLLVHSGFSLKVDAPEEEEPMLAIETESSTQILSLAYPNPFTEKATILFSVPQNGNRTTVEVFTVTGSRVATLFDSNTDSGIEYRTEFGAANLAEGIYTYRITSGDHVVNGKLVLIK